MGVSGLAEIAALGMAQTATIRPLLGIDGAGRRTYGPARAYPCSVAQSARPLYTAAGEQVFSSARVSVYPRASDGTELAAVGADAQITLPDGSTPRILRAGAVVAPDGGTIYFRIIT